MANPPASNSDWIGKLELEKYYMGPGFHDQNRKLTMEVNNEIKLVNITNVIATIKGTVEPGKCIYLFYFYFVHASHQTHFSWGRFHLLILYKAIMLTSVLKKYDRDSNPHSVDQTPELESCTLNRSNCRVLYGEATVLN